MKRLRENFFAGGVWGGGWGKEMQGHDPKSGVAAFRFPLVVSQHLCYSSVGCHAAIQI